MLRPHDGVWHAVAECDRSGISQDGGEAREFGWAFWDPALMSGPEETVSIGLRNGSGARSVLDQRCWVAAGVQVLRVYNAQLTTSELLQNFEAGPTAHPAGTAATTDK